jgi:hypothetical protein
VTVISSPYCNALAEHFNGALLPMLANDRVFNTVSIQLDQMNDLFKHPDYLTRFVDLRTKTIAESDLLVKSLKPIQDQINALRAAAALSTDPAAVKEMHDAAEQLQLAYLHQFQLSTDLTSLARAMIDYPIEDLPHPLSGWTPEEQALPADEKNIRIYLHFDKQRKSIDGAESDAVDTAYTIATTRCTKQQP